MKGAFVLADSHTGRFGPVAHFIDHAAMPMLIAMMTIFAISLVLINTHKLDRRIAYAVVPMALLAVANRLTYVSALQTQTWINLLSALQVLAVVAFMAIVILIGRMTFVRRHMARTVG